MPRKISRTKFIGGLIGANTTPSEEFFNTSHPTNLDERVGMLVRKVECILDAEFVAALLATVRFEFSLSQKVAAPTEVQRINDDGCIFSVQARISSGTHPIIFTWDAPPKGYLVVAPEIHASIYVGVAVDGLNTRWRLAYEESRVTVSEKSLVIP